MRRSVSLPDHVVRQIDDYRRVQPKLPSFNQAIIELLQQAMAVTEGITIVPPRRWVDANDD